MICKNCGSVYSDSEQYCPNCGASKFDFESEEQYTQENYNQNVTPENNQQYHNDYSNQSKENHTNNGLYIALGIFILVLVVGIVGGGMYYVKNKPQDLDKPTSYVMNFGGFDFDIQNEYVSDIIDDALVLTDKDENWMIHMIVDEGNFEELKIQKGQFQELMEAKGYKATPAEIKKISGVDFVVVELEKSNFKDPTDKKAKERDIKAIGAFAKLNSGKFAEILVSNSKNEFDYSLLERTAPIIKSVFMENEVQEVVDEQETKAE